MSSKEVLQSIIDIITKEHGAGSFGLLSERKPMQLAVIPSGSIGLDWAMGIGGFPRGRITEVSGPESGGKTTLALHAIANAQEQGLNAAFFDNEHAFDPDYAQALGVDIDRLLMSQPECAEQTYSMLETVCRETARDPDVGVALAVVDSVPAMVPRAELEGEVGDGGIGIQARIMSDNLRKLVGLAGRANIAIIFINQIREKIGVMWGSPEVTPGGRALKFYSSVRVDIRKVSTIKDDKEITATRHRIRVIKNKCARPLLQAEFEILFGYGIDPAAEVLELGVESGLIKQAGAWLSIEDQRLGQGKAAARNALCDDPDLLWELHRKIREAKLQNG